MDTDDLDMLQSRFLEFCERPPEEFKPGPFVLAIFGGTGDLSRRKLLPTLYRLHRQGRITDFAIVAIGSRQLTDEAYRRMIDEALRDSLPAEYSSETAQAFLPRLFYVSHDVSQPIEVAGVCERIREVAPPAKGVLNLLFYLAVPPQLLPTIIKRLRAVNACGNFQSSKVIIEKPFGRDQQSARELNGLLTGVFAETQIYRIDHYLGKDTVQSLATFRFGNSIFEPVWNRHYIDHVQMTVAEEIGVGHRGAFYEQAGVVRDIVQNHILQVLAFVAMEPPVGFEPDLIRDEKVKVFRTLRPMTDAYIDGYTVAGQYAGGNVAGQAVAGYREEENVAADSRVPTFFAGRLYVDNWRWAGVPFYIRAGKRLARTATVIYIQFRQPPLRLFGRVCESVEPNRLIFSIQPERSIVLRLNVKSPGAGHNLQPIQLEFDYDKLNLKLHPEYERLLLDCIKGDLTLFARQDEVEAMWAFVDPLCRRWATGPQPADFPNYPAGTWGPEPAQELISRDQRKWYTP